MIYPQSAPIIFFGNYHAFANSRLRIVTVGLNPSNKEFQDPDGNPSFWRFPELEKLTKSWKGDSEQIAEYLTSISRYFEREESVHRWFSSFETKLKYLGATFRTNQPSGNAAIHTDLCSPLATRLNWSEIVKEDKFGALVLEQAGSRLWNKLVVALNPQVMLVQVAFEHLRSMTLGGGDWNAFGGVPMRVAAWSLVMNDKTVMVLHVNRMNRDQMGRTLGQVPTLVTSHCI